MDSFAQTSGNKNAKFHHFLTPFKTALLQIPKSWPKQIKDIYEWPSATVAEPATDNANPYSLPWVVSLLYVIGSIAIGFSSSTLTMFGLMVFIVFIALIAFLTFAILSVADEKRDHDVRTRNIIYCLSWIFTLLTALAASSFLEGGFIAISFFDPAILIFLIPALAFLTFFTLWLINIIKYREKNKEKIKENLSLLITKASFAFWLISLLVAIVAFSTNIYLAAIFAGIFMGTFLIWLFKMLRNISKANEETKSKDFSFFCTFSLVATLLILPFPFAVLALIPLSISLLFLYLCIKIIRAGNRHAQSK